MGIKKILIGLFVTSMFISCDDILEVTDISMQEVQILAPKEGSVLTNNAVNFNWDALEEATGYKIQIATPNFENASQILLDSLVYQDSLGLVTTRLEVNLENGSYQWRIKGVNSGYETPFVTNGFLVQGDENADATPPNTPILVSPEDGAAQDETNVNYSWTRQDIPGTAERDSIYIFSDVELQTLETKGLGANKSFNITLSTNTYYWFVRSFDELNESDASTVFELTVN